MAFVKLHGALLDSSVWSEPYPTRLVWIAMLAMADQDGVVRASLPGLAHRARVTMAECEAALACLLGPSQHSSDGTSGERIAKVDRGWKLLNYAYYRELQTPRQAEWAKRKAAYRARTSGDVPDGPGDVRGLSIEAEAEYPPPTPPGGGGSLLPVSKAEAEISQAIRGIACADRADALHDATIERLDAAGWTCTRQAPVPDRGDGRRGYVDVRAVKAGVVAMLEIDRKTAREKSLAKLERSDVDVRIVLLRIVCAPTRIGRVLVMGAGIARNGKAVQHMPNMPIGTPSCDCVDCVEYRGTGGDHRDAEAKR